MTQDSLDFTRPVYTMECARCCKVHKGHDPEQVETNALQCDHIDDSRDLAPEAHARATDLPTSHAAAKSVRNSEKVRQNILHILTQWGALTDEEIAAHYALGFEPKSSPSGIRSRRAELVKRGKIKPSVNLGRTASGRECYMWEIAE